MILWPIVIIVGLYAVLAVALFFFQGRMVFIPIEELYITPDQVGLEYEDVSIPVSGGDTIHGWYFKSPHKDKIGAGKAVILCHGNAGNISHRLETVEFIVNQGADILLWDYRGYGKSSGSPTEQNCYDDAVACFQWMQNSRGLVARDIIVFGRSLGGAIAIELAGRVENGGLMVESSFTSAADMGRKMFPFLPIGWLLRYKFDSLDKVGSLRVPIVVAHSRDDEIISYEMGRRLFDAAPEPKRFVEFSGGHNERRYFGDDVYIMAWSDLLAGRLGAASTKP